jgi:hypothetical protein
VLVLWQTEKFLWKTFYQIPNIYRIFLFFSIYRLYKTQTAKTEKLKISGKFQKINAKKYFNFHINILDIFKLKYRCIKD